MNNLITSTTGSIHFASGVLALIAGSLILYLRKGTKLHKRIGYIYCFTMLILLASSFMIYRLFNGWGVFHYASVISSITLIIGMVPPLFLRHKSYWVKIHFNAMYWSVVGLWAAFTAEMSVRIPETKFFWMVGVAFGLVMIVGAIGFGVYKNKWKNEFGKA